MTTRQLASVALAVAVIPFAAAPATAAAKSRSHHGKRATKAAVTVKAAAARRAAAKPKAATAPTVAAIAAPAPAAAPAPSVNSVISIGGYVFYNLTYAEAVDAWLAAVAAAPAGYVPPTITSVSVTTTVGGTVAGGTR